MDTRAGSCHCGAVRFEVDIVEWKAIDCNCSICSKKGFLHLIVPPERFRLLQGEDELVEYRTSTKVARHLFCRHCGIHPFYRPRSHPDDYAANVRCLDDASPEDFEIQPFDGQNWESHIHEIR